VALAFDASSQSSQGTGDLSWTHTPVGTPRAALVLIAQNVGTGDEIATGVTYGAVAMTRVPTHGFLSGLAGTEDGACYAYFLGSGIPTGAQTIAVDVDATGSVKIAKLFTWTADGDCEIVDSDVLDAVQADPQLTLQTGAGVETVVGAIVHSGQNAGGNLTAVSGFTDDSSGAAWDFGTQVAEVVRSTSPHSGGDITTGWTATSEEAHMIAVAIKEAAGGGGDIVELIGVVIDATIPAAIGRLKRRSIGPGIQAGSPSELDSAIAVAKRKSKAVGTLVVAETARAISAGHAAAIGTATESESARALGRQKGFTIGVSTEANVGVAITSTGGLGPLLSTPKPPSLGGVQTQELIPPAQPPDIEGPA
jgi:hypothetical protein